MKKLLALLLCLIMAFALVACVTPGDKPDNNGNQGNSGGEQGGETGDNGGNEDPFEGLSVMTYEDYMAAEMDAPVYIEAYVQAHQSWWDNKITVYAADEDGAYFLYEMACSEENAAKLTPGTKIAVKGFKGEWAGEIEIMDATFEFVEGDSYIAEPVDLTDVLGTDELINYQNQLASFDELTVKSISFKNDGGDDIYVTLTKDGKDYSFCVERYLTAPDTDLYKTVAALQPGDIIDVVGFLYWYEGVNTHITEVTKVGPLSYEDYIAAEMDSYVVVDVYVQAHQSWWNNKITVYAADEDGAYFLYEMACSEEDAAKLTPGTKIRVYGYKGAWAGEIEIMDATFEFVEGEPYVAEAKDLTDLLGTDELINYQNQLASFKGLTVKSISFKNDGGDDIYVTLTKDGKDYSFCVERYLTAPDTDLYKAVAALKEGDVIDVTGFLYWYEGVNTHITAVTVK